MAVRRRDLDHGDIAFEPSRTEQILCIAQSYRQVVRESGMNRPAVVFTDEKQVIDEDPRVFFLHIRRGTECHELENADIFKLMTVGAAAEGVQESFRRIGESAQIDQIT